KVVLPDRKAHGSKGETRTQVRILTCKVQDRSRWISAVVALAILLGSSITASAQGCPMCYNVAAAARASAIHALKQGILVLLIPPLAMFIGIFALAFRRRNRFNDEIADTLVADRALDEMCELLPS